MKDIQDFCDEVYELLEDTYEVRISRRVRDLTSSSTINRQVLARKEREIASKDEKTRSRYAGCFLFFCISFLALRDVHREVLFSRYVTIKADLYELGSEEIYENPVIEENVARAFGLETLLFLRDGADPRYNKPLFAWLKILSDSVAYGEAQAAARNPTDWMFCKTCWQRHNKWTFVKINERCACCNSKNQFRTRPHKKYIAKLEKAIVELWGDYETYYPLALYTKSKLTELVHGKMRDIYLQSFAKHKQKFFESNKTFLKPSTVYFAHYDSSAGKSRRRYCYLDKEHISQMRMTGEAYDGFIKLLDMCIANKAHMLTAITLSDLRRLLLGARFPESMILDKIERDLNAWAGSSKLQA